MPSIVSITRRIEFDAGHRIPDHKSKCRNIHGHRYVLEATIAGALQEAGSDRGMIADFADLKAVMMAAVGEPWDHAFLVWCRDQVMISALTYLDTAMLGAGVPHKTIILDKTPTVENLVVEAAWLIERELECSIADPPRLMLVKLWETPNCFAEWINSVLVG